MKRIKSFSALFLALAVTVGIVACGSSSTPTTSTATTATSTTTGGTSTYSGTTTQATISSTNAQTVGAAGTSNVSTVQGIATGIQMGKPQNGANGLGDAFGKPIADAIAGLDGTKAVTTTAGTCGGTLVVDATGTLYTATYTNFCSGTSAAAGSTTNGTVTATGTPASFAVTMDVTSVSSSLTFVMKGTFTGVISSTKLKYAMTVAFTLTSSSGSAYAKLENLIVDVTFPTSTTYSEAISGRFYYDTTGYVDITTPTELVGSYTPGTQGAAGTIGKPTLGEMRFAGSGTTIVRVLYTDAAKDTYSYSTDSGATWTVL